MPTLILFEETDGLLSREQRVLRLHLDLSRLERAGAKVARYNLRDHPIIFSVHPETRGLCGQDLPVLMIDDRVVSRGTVPDLQQLTEWTKIQLEPGGCGGNGCTCGG